jgi:hypothetical protein
MFGVFRAIERTAAIDYMAGRSDLFTMEHKAGKWRVSWDGFQAGHEDLSHAMYRCLIDSRIDKRTFNRIAGFKLDKLKQGRNRSQKTE